MIISAKTIIRYVASIAGLTAANIVGRRRTNEYVRPRHVAMYLARSMTPRSLPSIGVVFGRVDHTTVLNACRRVEAALLANPLAKLHMLVLRNEIAMLSAASAEDTSWIVRDVGPIIPVPQIQAAPAPKPAPRARRIPKMTHAYLRNAGEKYAVESIEPKAVSK